MVGGETEEGVNIDRGGRRLTSVGLAQARPNKHRGVWPVWGSLRLVPIIDRGGRRSSVGLAHARPNNSTVYRAPQAYKVYTAVDLQYLRYSTAQKNVTS